MDNLLIRVSFFAISEEGLTDIESVEKELLEILECIKQNGMREALQNHFIIEVVY